MNRASKYFHYNDLVIILHPEVYDPAEDTFLLIEAINVAKDDTVLEIGTGCGLIALECARHGANVICTDINPYAIDIAKQNYFKNKYLIKGSFEVRNGDLFSAVKKDEVFDIIIFNPPYLPTHKKDLVGGHGWFDIATNGGIDGIKIKSFKFEPQSVNILIDKIPGKNYILFKGRNAPEDKCEIFLNEKSLGSKGKIEIDEGFQYNFK